MYIFFYSSTNFISQKKDGPMGKEIQRNCKIYHPGLNIISKRGFQFVSLRDITKKNIGFDSMTNLPQHCLQEPVFPSYERFQSYSTCQHT